MAGQAARVLAHHRGQRGPLRGRARVHQAAPYPAEHLGVHDASAQAAEPSRMRRQSAASSVSQDDPAGARRSAGRHGLTARRRSHRRGRHPRQRATSGGGSPSGPLRTTTRSRRRRSAEPADQLPRGQDRTDLGRHDQQHLVGDRHAPRRAPRRDSGAGPEPPSRHSAGSRRAPPGPRSGARSSGRFAAGQDRHAADLREGRPQRAARDAAGERAELVPSGARRPARLRARRRRRRPAGRGPPARRGLRGWLRTGRAPRRGRWRRRRPDRAARR